jgi:hypothetical protein
MPKEVAVVVEYVRMHPQLSKAGPRLLSVLKDLASTGFVTGNVLNNVIKDRIA